MKNMHELIDDIDVEKGNIEISEEDMSREEKIRISELTLSKLNMKNKKSFNKKLVLVLAASMTIILSFAVVFAQGGFNSIYYRLFGENIRYVNEMGTPIDEKYTSKGTVYNLANKFGKEGTSSENITLNVANMLGDEHSFYIIFELIKENGESFKDSDYIEFESLRLNFKTSGGYTWYQVEDDDSNDNKATFILAGNTKKKITGDKLSLYIKSFTEYSVKNPSEGFDAYNFLLNHDEYFNQKLIENTQKSSGKFVPSQESNENMPDEAINKMNEIYRLTPNYVLPWKYSDISVEKNFQDIYIDNIGFVEDKLCIRFAFMNEEENKLGDIYFVNKNNEKDVMHNGLMLTDEKDGVNCAYYIFDIKNMEELKNYNLKYEISKKLSTTEGEWEVKFKADYKNTTRTIKLNEEAEINGKKYTVKNVKISPIAVNIEMKNNLAETLKDPAHNLTDAASVIMKDGTTAELSSGGSGTNALSSSVNLMFKRPIDTNEIEKIKIGDIEIKP